MILAEDVKYGCGLDDWSEFADSHLSSNTLKCYLLVSVTLYLKHK